MRGDVLANRSSENRSEMDFYPTPSDVTTALLDYLNIPVPSVVWEPACGQRHMSDVIERQGHTVICSDIQDGTDFLVTTRDCDWIITNPPFRLASMFIEHSTKQARTAMPLKSQFWHASKRVKLFRETRPSHVLALTWRPNFDPKRTKSSSTMDVMWVVWDGSGSVCKYDVLTRPGKVG